MPKPSRLTRRRTLPRPHAGIEHRDVAAHAVAEQVDRRRARRRTARRGRARGRRGTRGRSRCRPPASSLAPKPRQSSASTWRSSANASTTNWNDAATSIQPCSMTSGGRSSATRPASPHSRRCWRSPRALTKRLRAGAARAIGFRRSSPHCKRRARTGLAAARQRGRARECRCQNRAHDRRRPIDRRRGTSRSGRCCLATSAAIVRLIHGLAEFEQLTHLVEVTPDDARAASVRAAAGRRGDRRRARRPSRRVRAVLHQFLDLPRQARALSRRPVRGARARGGGIGQALLEHLARLAATRGCGRFEWSVLDWNEGAIRFYQRMGATVMPDWRICRIAGAALDAYRPAR